MIDRIGHGGRWLGAVLLLVMLALPLVGRAAPVGGQPGLALTRSIITMAVDDTGNGWAWAADPAPNINGHLLRLENGAWREIPAPDPGAATLLKQTVVLDDIALTGKGDVRGIKIDPSLLKPEDAEVVEDLIIAAFTDAKGKSEAEMQRKMAEVTAGLPIPPGMKLPF